MKRICILVTGPNCSGKSTTVARVKELMVETRAHYDPQDTFDGLKLPAGVEWISADNDDRFKGSAETQELAIFDLWLTDRPVLVFEGTRINTPLIRVAKRYPDRALEVFMTRQTPTVMLAHLQARCEKRNKA